MDDKTQNPMASIEPIDSNKVGEVYDVGGGGKQHETSIRNSDVDVAAGLAEMFEGGEGYTRKEVVRLRWKLDLRLIPILWFNVLLPAMDKVSNGTAALYGLRQDLHLVGTQYAWVGSIFYVSLNRTMIVLKKNDSLITSSLATFSGLSHQAQSCKNSPLPKPYPWP